MWAGRSAACSPTSHSATRRCWRSTLTRSSGKTTRPPAAADALERRLDAAVTTHRDAVLKSAGRPPWWVRLAAPVVTLGALVWFPVAQPILELVLSNKVTQFSQASLLLIVQLLGATYLIQSVGMLAIYFVALWMLLRWSATKRVESALRRTTDARHPASAVLDWSTALLAPLRQHVEKLAGLSDRIAAVATQRTAA